MSVNGDLKMDMLVYWLLRRELWLLNGIVRMTIHTQMYSYVNIYADM